MHTWAITFKYKCMHTLKKGRGMGIGEKSKNKGTEKAQGHRKNQAGIAGIY